MQVTEIVQLAVQGGFAVVLVLAGIGIYRLAREWVPQFMGFIQRLTDSQAAHTERLSVTDAKVEALIAGQARLTASVEKLGDVASAAIVRAGDAAGAALGKLGDVVAAEGFETRSSLADAERRITAAVRREQASDPPPRSSATTPVTGVPAVRRPTLTG